MVKQLQVSIGEYSTKGVKKINQDFHDIHIPKGEALSTKGIAIALADGISSSDVSQIASKTAVVSFLQDYFATPESWSVKKSAQRVLSAANSWLYAQSQQGQYHYDKDRGYVCTFSAMILRSNTAYIFHIGDTRIYRIRNESIQQLTNDHRTWVTQDKSYLGRALGVEPSLRIDFDTLQVEVGDVFIFMTDGVYEFMALSYIQELLKAYPDELDYIAKEVIKKASDNGSDDNLTFQMVRVDVLPNKEVNEIHKLLTEKPVAPILEARMDFDGYEIVRELSASSRSHVYLAIDKITKSSVVIKTPSIDLKDDKAYMERFLLEEWIAKRLNSAHLLKAYEQSHPRHYLYTVCEYIQGQTLSQWVIDNPSPDIETVRDIANQIARGLYVLHRQEMIHQDLRPENVMIDKSGTVKIIDYGATRIEGIADINLYLQQEHLLGTMLYSAPEYFLGNIGTNRSDQFSLAVIIYYMISGEFPYGTQVAKSTTKSSQKKLKYKPLYLSLEQHLIPLWMDEALKKALQPDPYYRYSELSEFIYDLHHPNQGYINRTRPPIYERNPILFWKSIAIILAFINLYLLAFN